LIPYHHASTKYRTVLQKGAIQNQIQIGSNEHQQGEHQRRKNTANSQKQLRHHNSRDQIGSTKTRSALNNMLTSDKFRLDIKKFGFSNRSHKLWNAISPEIKQSRNLNEFKRKLHTIDFSPFLKGRK